MRIIKTLILPIVCMLAFPFAYAADWVGRPAPAFHLADQSGHWHDLGEFKGHWLAIYFYPKDGTPGCTTEARTFRDSYPTLQKSQIALVGVSLDTVESHRQFADSLQLPFPILADADRSLTKAMGVLRGFGPIAYARRETFLIDPTGTIVLHYDNVDPAQNAQQIVADVQRLRDAKH